MKQPFSGPMIAAPNKSASAISTTSFAKQPLPSFSGWKLLMSVILLQVGPAFSLAAELPRKDSLGDPLPAGALLRLGSNRFQHGGQISNLLFSPDGKKVITGGDRAIRVCDSKTGKQLLVWELKRSIHFTGCLAITPDGKNLISASDKVSVFDLATGRLIKELPCFAIGVALSADGKLLACVSARGVELWDLAAAQQVRVIRVAARTVAFGPEGRTLAVQCRDKKVRLFTVATGTEDRAIDLKASVHAVAFSLDGKMMASADMTIYLGDLQGGMAKAVPAPEAAMPAAVLALAFSPDGKLLASCDFDGEVRLIDVTTRKVKQVWKGFSGSHCLAFSPDAKILASSDMGIAFWDVASGKQRQAPLPGHKYEVRAAAFSPDGKTIASMSFENGLIFWDASTGKLLRQIPEAGSPTLLAFFPDGRQVCCASGKWSLATGKREGTLPLRFLAWAMALAPDGTLLAGSSRLRGFEVWNLPERKRILHLPEAHTRTIRRLLFAPDGRTLASAGDDGDIHLWRLPTGRKVGTIRYGSGEYHAVKSIAFSPDGKTLATIARVGSRGKLTAQLWETATCQQRQEMNLPLVHALAFSPSGDILAAGAKDGKIIIWDLAAGKPIREVTGHRGAVMSLAFSADGKRLVSGGSDTTLLIWDIPAFRRQK